MASRSERLSRAEINKIKESVRSGEYLKKSEAAPSAGSSRRERLKSTVSTQKQRVVDQSFLNRQNLNEQRLSGAQTDIVRPAETAPAQAMQQRRLEQGGPVPSVQPDFLKAQPRPGTFGAIQQFERDTPIPEKEPGINQRLGEQLREVPVLGSVLRGLDKVQEFTEPAANIAQQFYTPGAGLGALAAAEKGAVNLAGKVLPRASRLIQKAAGEAGVGAYAGAGQTLSANPSASGRDVALGTGIGAAGGAVSPLIGTGVQRGVNAIKNSNNLIGRLFGESNVGITAGGGSTKSKRPVTTEQQIVNNPLIDEVKSVLDNATQFGRSAYQNHVDYLDPLKRINQETYNAAQDAARANNVANQSVRNKFVDLEGNVLGDSLNDVMRPSRGLGKKVDDYLVLRHAITRLERGERVYDEALDITADKARELVKTLETRYPQLKEIGSKWNEYNDNLLKSGLREGLISQEAYDAMRAANPNYASMRRQFSTSEKLAQPKWSGAGSGFSGQSAPIKEVSPTGSTRRIVSPIRSAIEQTYAWKNAELRNRTMQEIVKAVQADPDGLKNIVEIVKKPSTSYKNLDEALREGGSEEFLEQLDNDFKNLFSKAKPGEENIVRAMVQGQPVYLRVKDAEAVKALLGMGNEESGIVLNFLQTLSNATKRGATGVFAPLFAVKNLSADTIQAAIQSPNAFKHLFIDVPHAFLASLRVPGAKKLADEFARVGGEYSSLLRGDRPLQRAVYNLRREAPLSPKGIAKGAWAAGKAPFKALEKFGDLAENLNRMAAYRRAIQGKPRTPENVRNAVNAAREITTNFSRKGAQSKGVEAFVPYSNAATQGLYRFTKALKDNPIKTASGIVTFALAPKLYEYSKFHDDPDYQKLPARERYRNVIIGKNADGTFNKVPLPPEYLAFGALMTDLISDIVEQDPQAYKGSLDAIVNAFTPPLVSGALQGATQGGGIEKSVAGSLNATTLAPAIATGFNQSFTGAPIVPERLQDLPTKFQYDERTSSIAKVVGDKIGLAPLKVDYLIRAYGGDPSRLLLPLFSPIGAGTPKNTLLRNFIVDPVFTNTLSSDYYDAKDAYTKAENANADFGEPLPDWYDAETHKLITSGSKGSPTVRLRELTADKRAIQGNQSLSPSQKAQQLRTNQQKINEIYLEVNSELLQSGYKFPNR